MPTSEWLRSRMKPSEDSPKIETLSDGRRVAALPQEMAACREIADAIHQRAAKLRKQALGNTGRALTDADRALLRVADEVDSFSFKVLDLVGVAWKDGALISAL